MNRSLQLLSFLFATAALAAEPMPPEVRAKLMAGFESSVKEADALIAAPEGRSMNRALSLRGDSYLFLGKFKESVADFERMIALDASQDAPHWRLGIAYYFAGDYAKSAKQFEKYHAYDNRDRENGVWKFFAQAKADGIDKARKEMLEYNKFDREPFPAVYEMLAGKKTPSEVFEELGKKNLKDDNLVMFFAHYYVGWYQQLLGNPATAKEHLGKAVELSLKSAGGDGPEYMGHVARLHYDAMKP
jgi:lipoprotein NlpI